MLRPTLVGRSLLLYGHHVRCHSRPSGTSVSAGRAVGARRASGARSNGSPSAASSAHGTGPRARRLQDRESDTEYDTRRRAPGGALDGVSQTAVCDTCGSATPTSRRRAGSQSLDLQARCAAGRVVSTRFIARQPRRAGTALDGVIGRFVRRITLRDRRTSVSTSPHRLCDPVSRCSANS